MSAGYLLTFHSQNISGNDFATNDHVALDQTLAFLLRRSIRIFSLREVALRLRAGTLDELPARYVGISFDDGTDFDWLPQVHPSAGPQESMGSIVRRHESRRFWPPWRCIRATSFVIASPAARRDIESCSPPLKLSDDWWGAAQLSGLMEIGNHGWDHVHPAVSEVYERPRLIEAFHNIDTFDEARRQVHDSADVITSRAGRGAGQLFAYPYGQVSEYMARDYLPRQDRVLAAFTTEGVPVTPASDVWRIPRFVCGHHFHDLAELEALIAG